MDKALQRELRLRKCYNDMGNILTGYIQDAEQERIVGNYDGAIRFSNQFLEGLTMLLEMEQIVIKMVGRDIQIVYSIYPEHKNGLRIMKKEARQHYRNSQKIEKIIESARLQQRKIRAEQISNQEE